MTQYAKLVFPFSEWRRAYTTVEVTEFLYWGIVECGVATICCPVRRSIMFLFKGLFEAYQARGVEKVGLYTHREAQHVSSTWGIGRINGDGKNPSKDLGKLL